jgi:hypothetical protein
VRSTAARIQHCKQCCQLSNVLLCHAQQDINSLNIMDVFKILLPFAAALIQQRPIYFQQCCCDLTDFIPQFEQ